MSIFDSLQSPNNAGAAFVNAFEGGVKKREEREFKSALSAYAVNPSDPMAFASIARTEPKLAITLRADQEKRAKEAQLAQLQQAAVAGDPKAKAQLAGIDYDLWDKINDNDRVATKDKNDRIGQSLVLVASLPPEQQPMAWDREIDRLSASGMKELDEYRGRFSPDALQSAVAEHGALDDFLKTQKIDYSVIPEGGRLQGFDAAGRPLAGGAASAPAGPPQVGTMEDGHEFIGGDPADPKSWRAVSGGGAGNGTGGFPG